MGLKYIDTPRAKRDKQLGYYTAKTGKRLPFPNYYRMKLYTEDERENIWIEKLENGIRYINRKKVHESEIERITKLKEAAREKNHALGYSSPAKILTVAGEEIARRRILLEKRLTEAETMIMQKTTDTLRKRAARLPPAPNKDTAGGTTPAESKKMIGANQR